MLYIIDYDLRKPGRDYDPLIAAIKAYGDWAHALKSTWVINTRQSAAQVRDNLVRHIDANDGLLVAEFGNSAAWHGLPDEISSWLRERVGKVLV